LLRIEDRRLPVYGLSLHLTVQIRIVEGAGAQHLLRWCTRHYDMERRHTRSMR
jgi:hypothetical protein